MNERFHCKKMLSLTFLLTKNSHIEQEKSTVIKDKIYLSIKMLIRIKIIKH